MLGPAQSAEGRRFISFQPMRLSKNENPMLALSWTLFHPVDADSPIYGLSETELLASEMNFVLSINGLDETFVSDGVRSPDLRRAGRAAWP